MKNNFNSFRNFFGFVLLFIFVSQNSFSQTTITCKVDGDEFKGKIEEAVQVSMGSENLIQIKSSKDDEILYIYIKVSKLNGEMPISLSYKNHDIEKGEMPDAEIIWVPDGPDNPQWNTVDGTLIVSQFDPAAKTISGTFEFTVEKFEYGSKAKNKRPSVVVKDGKFDSVQYKIEEKKEGD